MPELPEAEITTQKLKPLLLGKRFLGFWTNWPRGVAVSKPAAITRDIKGRKVLSLARRGKAILVRLSGGRMLALHQKMSGKVLVLLKGTKDKHIHHRFPLSPSTGSGQEGGKELVLHDIRKFGRVWYGKEADVLRDPFFAKLGREPLELSFVRFGELFLRHKGMVKPLLLRQDVFAGIGNIVADESLWRAKVHPCRRIETLTEPEVRRVYDAIRFILKKSIALGGSTMRDWRHPDLSSGGYYPGRYVYNRRGERCKRCGTTILRIVVGSRGTYICPKCQRNHDRCSPFHIK
ncbi:MAG: bifunctional DNA-formamidopyrimidine glycosylase/DNA-(apurinic or apyrimidinic site) lyase [bacterium]|nr:bifunctional DNA-formamidopyrimidine glycosylase/DNA-(apurinic or apyrimidinic site) lyase [bacterium]